MYILFEEQELCGWWSSSTDWMYLVWDCEFGWMCFVFVVFLFLAVFCSNCSNQSFYRGSGSSGRSTEYGLIINNIVFQRDSTMNCGLWTVDVCNYIVLWNQEWQFLGLTSSSGPNLVLKPESRVQSPVSPFYSQNQNRIIYIQCNHHVMSMSSHCFGLSRFEIWYGTMVLVLYLEHLDLDDPFPDPCEDRNWIVAALGHRRSWSHVFAGVLSFWVSLESWIPPIIFYYAISAYLIEWVQLHDHDPNIIVCLYLKYKSTIIHTEFGLLWAVRQILTGSWSLVSWFVDCDEYCGG